MILVRNCWDKRGTLFVNKRRIMPGEVVSLEDNDTARNQIRGGYLELVENEKELIAKEPASEVELIVDKLVLEMVKETAEVVEPVVETPKETAPEVPVVEEEPETVAEPTVVKKRKRRAKKDS